MLRVDTLYRWARREVRAQTATRGPNAQATDRAPGERPRMPRELSADEVDELSQDAVARFVSRYQIGLPVTMRNCVRSALRGPCFGALPRSGPDVLDSGAVRFFADRDLAALIGDVDIMPSDETLDALARAVQVAGY